jgi:hypothetical protein
MLTKRKGFPWDLRWYGKNGKVRIIKGGKVKIQFENVGRDSWNGIIEKPDTKDVDTILNYAQKEAKKYLLSRFINVEYDVLKNEGEISAGFRSVGTFKVV